MDTFRDYTVLSEIGRGGMGVVYRAMHNILGTHVSLKVIHGHLARSDEKQARSRFIQEAMLMARLDHPNIIKLQTCFEENGRLVIVTELLKGRTLADILTEHSSAGYPFCSHVLSQLVEGIAYAHSHNIIHRDLKPSNIFVTEEGVVKIFDFGVGKQLGNNADMTSPGVMLGTPQFMAPETLRAKRKVAAKDIGPEGDIYAIGVILYRMLTRKLPYNIDDCISAVDALTELAVHYSAGDPIEPLENLRPDIPFEFNTAVMHCMSMDASRRPSAAMLRQALANINYANPVYPVVHRLGNDERFLAFEGDAQRISLTPKYPHRKTGGKAGGKPDSGGAKRNNAKNSKARNSSSGSYKAILFSLLLLSLIVGGGYWFVTAFLIGNGKAVLNVVPGEQLSVTIDGERVLDTVNSPVTIDGLKPGPHTFLIRRDGYKDQSAKLKVMPNGVKTENISLVPHRKAAISVASIPAGCDVEIDGQKMLKKTPALFRNLKAGTHQIRLIKDGYRPVDFTVKTKWGKTTKPPPVRLPLNWVEVTMNTEPQGCPVALHDGDRQVNLGVTPAILEIETNREYEVIYTCGSRSVIRPLSHALWKSGDAKISLSPPPCEPTSEKAGAHRSRHKKRDHGPKIVSSENMGYLSVQSQPWSRVFVNGSFVKNTPVIKMRLKPGRYNVTLENDELNVRKNIQVTLKAGETTLLTEKLI